MSLANQGPHFFCHSDDHQILKWDFKSGEATQVRLSGTHLRDCHTSTFPLFFLFPTVYLQVVKLPKETYATDIHWFPPGVSSKKTSNQSDLFVLACTDGQSGVVRGHVTCMRGHVTCMRSCDLYEVM